VGSIGQIDRVGVFPMRVGMNRCANA